MLTTATSPSIDLKRPILLRIATLSLITLSSFGIFNLLEQRMTLAALDLILAALLAVLIITNRTHPFRKRTIILFYISISFVLFSYLFCTGGSAGTGIFWIFLFPFIAFFVNGLQLGALWSATFFLLNGCILLAVHLSGHPIPYEPDILSRAAMAYIFIASCAGYFESLHYQSQHRMQLDSRQFETLVKNSYDVLAIVNPTGHILYLSPSFEPLTGHAITNMIGKSGFDFIHNDDHKKIRTALNNLSMQLSPIEREEYRFRTRDNEWLTVEAIGQPVADPDGAITIVVNIRDISERTRMEASLQQSREKYSALFHSSRDAIMIHDHTGTIIDCNKATEELFERTAGELHGMKLATLMPEAMHAKARGILQSFQQTGRAHFEIQFLRKNGIPFLAEVLANTVTINDQQQIQGVVRDISEQRRIEEQLRQSQKMEAIGTLVGGIAHDFNNTLAAIQGNLYLARIEQQKPDVLNSKLDQIDALSNYAADMVQQLLTFSRKDDIHLKSVSLNECLYKLNKLSASLIPENIQFSIDICDRTLCAEADETQLQQLIMNLLSNARDAVANSTAPSIRCSLAPFEPDSSFLKQHPEWPAGCCARISLQDNGCGIPEETLQHIFEPFYTTKEVGKGTGLGMAMVYGVVQTHHGLIDIDSRLNQGTTMHIYLPLLEMPTPSIDCRPLAVGTIDRSSITLLIADDQQTVRDTAEDVLKSLGYQTLVARNGEALVDLFNQQPDAIHCVVTDIVMPGTSGIEAASRIRKIRPELPVIFVSGYDITETILPDNLNERTVLLSKPYSIHQLDQHILSLALGQRG